MMRDPTNHNLEAALLDQVIAGQFTGKSYCFVPVLGPIGWAVGVAVANERGYTPLSEASSFQWERKELADDFCDGMNRHIGLDEREATKIIVSTMGGRPYIKIVEAA